MRSSSRVRRRSLARIAALACTVVACAPGERPRDAILPNRTQVSDAKVSGEPPAAAPGVVYVTDFEYDVAPQAEPQGLLPGGGPLRSLAGEIRGETQDPVKKAAELQDLLARSIVEDLEAKKLSARRLGAGEPRPAEGWLLRGVFTELDGGDPVRKAIVGFGAGSSELGLYVSLTDLTKDGDVPFYSFDATNQSGKMPGAAVMKFNPYVAAAKFVMSRHASETEVTKTAEQIAEEVAGRVAAPPATPAP